jgi:hypothetical protein
MFQFINTILEQFLPCFNRQASWVNFCAIIIGFIIRPDTRGVSSVISALRMKEEHYTTLLKFFRSSAFDIDGLYRKLITVFLKILPPKTIDGTVILIGDHIKIAKEGRGMPAIEKLPQESQNSNKGTFIEGHLFGFISMVIPGFNRSIPVMAGLQESKTKTGGESLVEQMTYSLEKRKKGTLPVLPKERRMFQEVGKTKKTIETYVFCHCLGTKAPPGLWPLHSADCGNEVADAIPRRRLNSYNSSIDRKSTRLNSSHPL